MKLAVEDNTNIEQLGGVIIDGCVYKLERGKLWRKGVMDWVLSSRPTEDYFRAIKDKLPNIDKKVKRYGR